MDGAWGDWYHCTAHTYGAWLPGSELGHRERHHREHVEGDYRHRPAESDREQLERSRRLMKRGVVWLPMEARREACRLIAEALRYHKVEFAELVVTAMHLHLLARFPPSPDLISKLIRQRQASRRYKPQSPSSPNDGPVIHVRNPLPRYYLGKAKSWCTTQFQKQGLEPCPPRGLGGLWARRSKIEPVRDAAHFGNVGPYIRRHKDREGGVLASEA